MCLSEELRWVSEYETDDSIRIKSEEESEYFIVTGNVYPKKDSSPMD